MDAKLILVICIAVCTANAFSVEPWLGVHERCNDPSFWCKNEENAKECGVYEYCKIGWQKNNHQKETAANVGASPIEITLYYESYCPGCREFITTQWYPTYKKLKGTGVLKLELVPYGNAQEYKKGSKYIFYCQHGNKECIGNIIEACAIKHLGNITAWAPFIYCMESHLPSRPQAQSCAKSLGFDYSPIDECANGAEGNQLEHEMAVKTGALNPPHQYVPWIVVDGVHTSEIQSEVQTGMLEYVCKKYKGPKPAACQSLSKKLSNVCYKD